MIRFTRRRALLGTAAAAAAAAPPLARPALAQPKWPNRPVQLICPWAAGGGTDAVVRIVANLLERDLGQPFNVVNRTGGSGVVGHAAIAQAAPDGYSLGIITAEICMLHWQGLTELTYKSYTPLALMNNDPPGIQVNNSAPYKDVKALADAIKAGPPGKFKAVRHRPGRHLAPGAGRLARRHGAEGRPRALGALQRRRAGHAGPRRRRPRPHHLLGAGSAGDAGRRGAPAAWR